MTPTPLMNAIATMEGFFAKKKTLAQINNNPGNLRAGKRAVSKDANGYARYTTVEDGWADLSDLIGWYARRHFTLFGMMERYAPSADKNDPDAYARFICQRVKCQMDTPVEQLLKGPTT